jgi:hypothetical protein
VLPPLQWDLFQKGNALQGGRMVRQARLCLSQVLGNKPHT